MVLDVNTANVLYNIKYFRSRISPRTKIMAMVKAFGYGLGNPEMSKLLEKGGIDYLGVAYTSEGINLRKQGIKAPIMVMNPGPDEYPEIIKYNLEPEVYSLYGLKTLNDLVLQTGTDVKLHLKIETGMNRLGLDAEDIVEAIKILKSNPNLDLTGILSHLSSAEMPEEQEFTKGQITEFDRLSAEISKALDISPIRHLLNSAGAFNYSQHQFDMIRLGISIYGIDRAFDRDENPLRTVCSLKARISQVKLLKEGDSVGYSRAGIIKRDGTAIATVALGYADGYYRSLGNGRGKVFINGHLAPTFGNICMDMFMIDVTGIPVKEGDEVEIFGDNLPVEDLASWADTIPYEVFTSIGERVKRNFY